MGCFWRRCSALQSMADASLRPVLALLWQRVHCVSSAWLMALVAGMRLVLHRANRANGANRLRCSAALGDEGGCSACRAGRTLRCARFGGFCRRGAALAARALREQCLAHAPWCVVVGVSRGSCRWGGLAGHGRARCGCWRLRCRISWRGLARFRRRCRAPRLRCRRDRP